MKIVLSFVLTIYLFLTAGVNAQQDPQINYFNCTPPPSDSVVIFAKAVVSKEGTWEEKMNFLPDGKEVIFARHYDSTDNYFRPNIMHSEYTNGTWTASEKITFGANRTIGWPVLGLNGTMLFMEEVTGETKNGVTARIVYSKKQNGKWTEPVPITPEIEAKEGCGLAQMTDDSTLYFYSRYERVVYSSKSVNGKLSPPQMLPSMINPAVEFFVSPKNDYIIFLPLNWSNQFHISFHKGENQWTTPQPFSDYFESKKGWDCKGYGPSVSPDGKYFFFGHHGDMYWVTTDFINYFRKKEME